MEKSLKDVVWEIIKKSNYALDPETVFEKSHADNIEEFVKIIEELQTKGKLILTKKGKIASTRSAGMLPAKIISQAKGFAFAQPLSGGTDVFILSEKLKGAIVGDTVLLYKLYRSNKGLNGEVQRILEKGSRMMTGTIERWTTGCELIPDAPFRYNISVERGATLGARNGDKVQVILSSNRRKKKLSARVIKIYGKADSAKICADAIIDANGIPSIFSKEVITLAKKALQKGVTQEDLKDRLDLRKELIFTIDSADAKDLDDAVSIKKTENGWELGVHIADVSHYVKENTALDQEAFLRGTSVYFSDRVIPMLPEELSNGICSLNAGEDKLTFSSVMQIDQEGRLLSYEFRKSVINSKVRGVYSEINQILDQTADDAILEKYKIVMDSILEGKELADLLEKCARQRGNMDLESGESRFVLDENGVCVDIFPRNSGESERMIEHFMIMANQAAALYAKSADIPFVYRVHEEPDPEKIRGLSELAGALGIKNRHIREGMRAGDFADLLNQAKDTPSGRIISHQVLRTMAKARYDAKPLGHFGLSLTDYCHFTSPIRRYPDTAIHRILSALVGGMSTDKIKNKYEDFARQAAKESSICEVRAMKAQRDAEKCYMAEFMTQHIGEEFDGVISGMIYKGIFVELLNSVEGFISMERFEGCDYSFDGLITFTDKRSGKKLTIGDHLKVKVLSAHVATGTIDFTPVNEE